MALVLLSHQSIVERASGLDDWQVRDSGSKAIVDLGRAGHKVVLLYCRTRDDGLDYAGRNALFATVQNQIGRLGGHVDAVVSIPEDKGRRDSMLNDLADRFGESPDALVLVSTIEPSVMGVTRFAGTCYPVCGSEQDGRPQLEGVVAGLCAESGS